MSPLGSWIASRRPVPPADLSAGLRLESEGGLVHEALAAQGRARLAQSRAQSGRVRESAFRLLEADALITYACEAALDTEHPAVALRAVLAATKD